MRPEIEVIQQHLTVGERWDIDVLNSIVDSLQSEECSLLRKNDEDDASFNYLMKKIRKRHRDVVAGVTTIKAGQVQLTEKSSITEVINSPDAYSDLKAKGIKRLCDMPYAKRYETESATLLNKE